MVEVNTVCETCAANCNPHGTLDGVHVALCNTKSGEVGVLKIFRTVRDKHGERGVDGGDRDDKGGGATVLTDFIQVCTTAVKGLKRFVGVMRSCESVPSGDGVGEGFDVASDLHAEVFGAMKCGAHSSELRDDLFWAVLQELAHTTQVKSLGQRSASACARTAGVRGHEVGTREHAISTTLLIGDVG
jgi:hypothetical protein